MPPRQFYARQGHVPFFGWIIMVVVAAIAWTVPVGMSGAGGGTWAGDGDEVGCGAVYMSGEWDLIQCFCGGVCWCAHGIVTWMVYVCWGFIFVCAYPAVLE